MSSPGWYPDPFTRFPQRYFDGTAWTEHVLDTTGTQSFDPPHEAHVPDAAPAQGIVDVVVVALGALAILVGDVALDWYHPAGGLKLRDVHHILGRGDVGAVSRQFFEWGWLVGIAVVVIAFASLLVPALRWVAVACALVTAAWYAFAAYDISVPGARPELGAWLAVAGLVVCAVGAGQPARRFSSSRSSSRSSSGNRSPNTA